ncbi:UNVERIFIED_CONTAM: G-protein-signaling modulator 2 [Trichonephila clavipes]
MFKLVLIIFSQICSQSLKIMLELGDRSAQGRACGNLGNTHYLLGNFNEAITYHNERLKIAKEFKDLAAERRAHNNLGNAHIFLGEFEVAAEHYKKTLSLAIELRDKAIEAQAYYSLGNTYTLLHDYPTAIEYHLRHLKIAQELKDRIGEGRAYWSLGNAHSAVGNHEQALHFANRHLEISKEVGDHSGEVTAQHCISDLKKALEIQEIASTSKSINSCNSSGRMRRISMEHMDLLKLTPDGKAAKNSVIEKEGKKLSPVTEKDQLAIQGQAQSNLPENSIVNTTNVKENPASVRKDSQELENSMDEESFFDLLSRFQSKRMDDQRCSLVLSDNKENNQLLGNCQNNFQPSTSQNNKAANVDKGCLVILILFKDEIIAGMLKIYLLSNRLILPLPFILFCVFRTFSFSIKDNNRIQDDLFDLIAGMQSRRLDEQRASLPRLPGLNYFSLNNGAIRNNNNTIPPEQGLHRPSVDASSMPDDEFFEMLMRCQASRIEDQRSSMPDISARPHQMYSMAHCNGNNTHAAPTVPDEDFFSLIMRLQSGRIEDQRSTLPVMPPKEKSDTLPSSSSHSSKAAASSSKTGSLRSSLKSAKGSLKR